LESLVGLFFMMAAISIYVLSDNLSFFANAKRGTRNRTQH